MSLTDRPYMQRPSSTPSQNRGSNPRVGGHRLRNLIGFLIGLALTILYLGNPPISPPRPAAPPPPTIAPSPSVPVGRSPYAPYLDQVVPASTALRTLAYSKIQDCPSGDRTCALVHLYRYVQHDIGYLSDPAAREYIQPPQDTLAIGAGDCEDLSILLASLLENVGVSTYLVFTNSHAYTLACGVDLTTLRPAINQAYTAAPTEHVTEETHWINPQTVLSWSLTLPRPVTLHYALDATEPIDWLVVPTPEDADAARQGRQYRTYPCSRDNITHLDTDCQVGSTPQLLARNRTTHAVRLASTVRYLQPATPPTLPSSLQTYTIDGQTCLVLDPSIKGLGFPGQSMLTVVTAPERIAVNRAGYRHRL